MEPQIQFCTSADGTRIAYTVFGAGPPLVQVPRWAHCIEWMAREPEIGRFYEKLAEQHTVVIVERRGTGASQREVEDFALDRHIEDLAAVVDKLGLERFALFGAGDSGGVCLSYAAQHPERVTELVLWGSYARMERWQREELQDALTVESALAFADLFKFNWPAAAKFTASAVFPAGPLETQRRAEELWLRLVPARSAFEYLRFTWSFALLDILPRIAAPTLALYRRKGQTGGHAREASEEIAAGVQDGRVVGVDGDCQIAEVDHEQVLEHMLSFLAEDAPPAAVPPVDLARGIRYATSADGTKIAYEVRGSAGGVPLVNVYAWFLPAVGASGGIFERNRCCVFYDRRGTGSSQREAQALSLEAQVADLRAVIDAVGTPQVDLVGYADGAAVCLAYAGQHPERVRKVALWGAYACAADFMRQEGADRFARLIRDDWSARRTMPTALASSASTSDFLVSSADALRRSMTQDVAAGYIQSLPRLDIRKYLSNVRAPVLVMHRRGDRYTPLASGQAVASALSDARLVIFEGNNPLLPPDEDRVAALVTEFLDGAKLAPPPPTTEAAPAAAAAVTASGEPPIRYARTKDGVNIAYYAVGHGPALLVMPPMTISHLTFEMRIPSLRDWYGHLSRERTLVRFDPRTMGLSQRGVQDLSQASRARDVEAVAESTGSSQVDIVAFSGPTIPALQFAAARPELVGRVVLIDAMLQWSNYLGPGQVETLLSLVERDWELFCETYAHTVAGWTAGTQAHEFARLIATTMSPDDVARNIKSWAEYNVTTHLRTIEAPTLVIVRGGHPTGRDYVTPARQIVSSIPSAQLIEIPYESAAYYESQKIRHAIDEFLQISPTQPRRSPHGTAIILFADIVDSTGLTERIGDTSFRDKARVLDQTLRRVIESTGGTAIAGRTLGDGVLATFPAARPAIEAALRCASAGDDAGLPLHLGLHAGDVIREGADIYGGAVNIAARISGLTGPSELLVSDIVRGLARTSADVVFEDRGEHTLKGVSDAVRVYAVRPK